MTDEFSGYNHIVKVMTQEEWIKKNVKSGNPKDGNKLHKFIPCRFGAPQVGEKYKPSLNSIELVNKINDPVQYDLIHIAEIVNGITVLFNGVPIATAPERGDNNRKKTPAQKLTFCKSVIWSIIPRDMNVYAKDTNGKMVIQTVSDDSELKRYIALYPALITNQDPELQQIMNDEKPAIIAAPVTITESVIKTVKSFIPKYTIIEEIFNPVTKQWAMVAS